MCTSSISNVIYHKFSYGAAFYTLNGKNVNVMLEWLIKLQTPVVDSTLCAQWVESILKGENLLHYLQILYV